MPTPRSTASASNLKNPKIKKINLGTLTEASDVLQTTVKELKALDGQLSEATQIRVSLDS